MSDCRELIEICRKRPCPERPVYIQTHNFPDPDAIASAYGLKMLFGHFGIDAILCYEGKIDKLSTRKMMNIFQIEMFAYEEIRSRMRPDDYIICVDSQKGSGNITDFVGDEIASIDHHPTYVPMEYRYKDVEILGSCATKIAEYFRRLEVPMDKVTATALVYGLKNDTMQLSRDVTPRDIEVFGFLFEHMDEDLLRKLENNTMEYRDLKAYGAAIENITIYGKVGVVGIPFECNDALVAIISDFILHLDEIEVVVVYSLREDGIKFSMRASTSQIRCGEAMNRALKGIGNGGGHIAMSGGLIPKETADRLGSNANILIRERFLTVLSDYTETGEKHG